MVHWDRECVSDFLDAQAVFEDNSSYTFTFKMLGASAVLRVFPFSGDVQLHVGDSKEPMASWHLNCSAITFNDDEPDEGGPSMAFIPVIQNGNSRTTHWTVLGKD